MTGGELPVPTGDPAAESASDGPLDRLLGVLMSPGETFAKIVAKPTWILPMAIATVLSVAAGLVLFSKVDPEEMKGFFRAATAEAFADRGIQMPADQVERMIESQVSWTAFAGKWAALLFVPLFSLIGAAIYHWTFRAFGATCTFGQTFGVYCWGVIPAAIKALAAIAVGLARSDVLFTETASIVQANLSFLVDPSAGGSAWFWGILAAFDLFAIWGLYLRITGMSRLPGVSKGLAVTVSVVLFLVANGFAAYNLMKMAV